MRVALVHDFLTQLGGAERVLECFHELFPEAPVYTLVYDEQRTDNRFKHHDIRISFIQSLPGGVRHYKWYLPLMARAVESFKLDEYDLVLSDASAFAKGVKTSARHVSYIHTPTRYIWQEQEAYVKTSPAPRILKPLVNWYLKDRLRSWDYEAAQSPDQLIANSKTVQKRIRKYYNRESEVVYPPVDTGLFRPAGAKHDYFLTAGRMEPYKKVDLVIEAFKQLELPLKVVGGGSMSANIKYQIANSKNIELLGRLNDDELAKLVAGARAFVFPALEDAGIMVLEALSAGTPVIGLGKGGTAEFIIDGRSGVLFEEQSVPAIVSAVKRLQHLELDPEKLRIEALPYDRERFKQQVMNIINK